MSSINTETRKNRDIVQSFAIARDEWLRWQTLLDAINVPEGIMAVKKAGGRDTERILVATGTLPDGSTITVSLQAYRYSYWVVGECEKFGKMARVLYSRILPETLDIYLPDGTTFVFRFTLIDY